MEKSVNIVNYEPLPSDGSQIRLVTIISAKKEEEIECVIAHYPFTEEAVDNLKYEALSYVWGDATVTAPIKLNGQIFHATKNLEAALRMLRLQNEERLIWIDAICINQSSIEDRNQEVRRMDRIYRYAVRTVVWLGSEREPSEDITLAGMDPRRNNQVADDTYDLFILLANADPNDPEDAAMILHRTSNEIYGLSLLNRFFNRQWFRRVWILQEIALAKTATVIYGHRSMNWDLLMKAVDALNRLQQSKNRHIWNLTAANRAYKVHRCRIRALQNQQQQAQVTMHFQLVDLLWQTRFCEMTEPRDRLYGLLGLINGDLSSEKLLEIDYAKPVSDVFLELSIFMIQRGLFSHTLCCVANSMDGLPSWASDWKAPLFAFSPNGSPASGLSKSIVAYMQSYQLQGLEPPPNPPRFSPDLRQLTLRGRVFDAYGIWHIAERFDTPALDDQSLHEKAQLFRDRLIQWEDDMERQQCSQEKFKTPDERRQAWRNAILHELPGEQTDLGLRYQLLTDREVDTPNDSAMALRTLVDFTSAVGDNFELRRPFVTMLGQMGSTGNSCEVEYQDVVCVFVGSAVPYLLRPMEPFDRSRGGPYSFIGCCWVPGLIDIDIAEGERRGLFELQDITLI